MASSGASRPPRPNPPGASASAAPWCSGEGVGDRESIVLDALTWGPCRALLRHVLTPRRAIARYAGRTGRPTGPSRSGVGFAAWIESAAGFID